MWERIVHSPDGKVDSAENAVELLPTKLPSYLFRGFSKKVLGEIFPCRKLYGAFVPGCSEAEKHYMSLYSTP